MTSASSPPDGAPGKPRGRAKAPRENRRKLPPTPRGLRPGERHEDRHDLPTTEFRSGLPILPERFSDAWWELHNPPPLRADQRRMADPPPPGYRYRMDGMLVPIIESRIPLSSREGQDVFLEVLQYTGSQRAAMDAIGVAQRGTVETHLNDPDSDFGERYDAALARHRDMIYQAAVQRAVHGVEKPIIGGQFKDEIIAYERVYSDSLTALLLKRHFEEFRQAEPRGTNVNVTNTQNIAVKVDYKKLTRAQRQALRQVLQPADTQALDARIEEAVREDAQDTKELPAAVTEDAIDANCKERP